MAAQCSILFINTDGFPDTQSNTLRALGFEVVETRYIPEHSALSKHHAVILRVSDGSRLPVIAARLRAAPLFGRRVLISLVPAAVPLRERREAIDSGFDLVLPTFCSARDLAAAILGRLRKYPEHRCVLRSHGSKRRTAA